MSLFLMTFVSECESYKNPKGIMISQDHILLQISCSTVKLLLICHPKKTNKRKYKQTKTGKPQNASVTPLNCQIYFTSEGGLMKCHWVCSNQVQ